ncbi:MULTISPECIES: MFS transporter [Proteus]|jgi:MFS family permease|uniref:MFS-family transporter n=1 Tax=Proteus vulgaris TaxID=585 RepID=A0A379F518_PROVU|nr:MULTISPECIES: MFS transporter [Proteus]NBN61490.1 MFS transporter [Proteus sp. G2639]RNT26658.1 MFS transporter [Proteus mirabilis]AYY80035.1 MFS transporter [Proteus vulgaris]KGA60191.1 major Facilitator Superfamily protein [Proteus vulgaris]MBG5972204.1 MFS transporter [Proteus vulgaris]
MSGSVNKKEEASWGMLLHGKNSLKSLALAGGVALHAINVYITITTLPSVVRDIGGLNLYAWNTTVFILASILFSAVTSRLLSKFAPRNSYLLATLCFLVGSVICATAPSMQILLFGRFVQGAGGGMLLALAYSLVRVMFPQPLWSRAMALMSSMWGISTLLGPALGGIFAEYDIWRGAFWSILVVGIPYAILLFTILPTENVTDNIVAKSPLPYQQLFLLMFAVLSISIGGLYNITLYHVLSFLLAIIFILLLIHIDKKSNDGLFPKGTFSFSAPLAPIYLTMALLGISVQTEVFVPYFLQTIHNITPLLSGYLAALVGAGWSFSAIISSSSQQYTAQRLMRFGPIINFSAIVILGLFISNSVTLPYGQIIVICVALFFTGAGIGMAWPHYLTRVLHVSQGQEAQKAATSITTIQLFSAAVGASISGTVVNMAGLTDPGGIIGAKNAAHWLFIIFAVTPLIAFFTAQIVVSRTSKN